MSRTLNILIVDDVEFSRELLRAAIIASIKDNKWKIDPKFYHLASGKDILDVIEMRKIHLLYLDIELPEKSGLELLTSIKELFSELAVVMVSGEGSSENVMQAIQGGANGFIVKPFNTAKINESLINFFKQRAKS